MKKRNKFGGGQQTNVNGLAFEEKASLTKVLNKIDGIQVFDNSVVHLNGEIIGQILVKHELYKWFKTEYGVNISEVLSAKLLPDCVFYNLKLEKLFILEVKFQSSSGSIDEKLQTFQFKKHQYVQMMRTIEKQKGVFIDVEYIYILNEWFKDKRYIDVLNYVRDNGFSYYFNEIPINKLGIY